MIYLFTFINLNNSTIIIIFQIQLSKKQIDQYKVSQL
jgi:hypothetical protein